MTAARVVTHGCRANLAERDALAALAPAGATVVNSCAVTADAVRDARAAVRAAAADGPVYVTGCAATLDPARFADVAQVVPNARKLDAGAWGRAGAAPPPVTRQSRGFVAVQDGCDHSCTFCVTRLARGPSRSTPVDAVLDSVRTLAGQGVNEVVLTGIDTTSYGQDLPDHPRLGRPTIGRLVQALLAHTAVARLRLSSLDCAEADDALVEAFADPRLMPHVHLSLQSGDDLILKRMKRRHSRADAVRLVARLKAVRADIAVGADLIAGFPTEGEAAHGNSLSLIADCDLAHAHIFPFSPRSGTAAARMPKVPQAVARARAAALRDAAAERHKMFQNKLLNTDVHVISEGMAGLSPQGFKVRFAQQRPRGALVCVQPATILSGMLCE